MFKLSEPCVNDASINHLKEIFPTHSEDILKRAMDTSDDLEDTVQNVLDMTTEAVNEIRQSNITSKGRFSESNVFNGLKDIMKDYRKELNGVHFLKIDRSEIWQMALRFYKKALQKTDVLKKELEVSLSHFLDVIVIEKRAQEKN